MIATSSSAPASPRNSTCAGSGSPSHLPTCRSARAASTLAGFSIAGPRARELLQRLVRIDLSADAFRLFSVRETAVGFAPAILTRAGFTGELGYEVWTTPDYLATLYDELWEAGRDLGLVHFGGRALSSLRLEKGYGSFNKDFRPDYTPGETGLDRFIDFAKPDFVGRDAALAERPPDPSDASSSWRSARPTPTSSATSRS